MRRKILMCLALVAIGGALAVAFGTNHSYVSTTSMTPTIPPGSMIFVAKEDQYHVGDVIEFRNNGIVWAHRVIAVKPGGVLVTKGDNPHNSPDIFNHPTTTADVIGKVVAAPRWLGFPELIAHHPAYGLAWLRYELGLWGRLLLVAVAAGISFLFAFGAAIGRDVRSRLVRHRDRGDVARHRAVIVTRIGPEVSAAYALQGASPPAGAGRSGRPARDAG